MKILILSNLYPPHHIGGYELICQTVMEQLRERGHALAILTSDHQVAAAQAAGQGDEEGVQRLLQINGLYGHPWRGIRALRWLEQHNNQTLRSALDQHRPELVYVWNMGGLSKSLLFTLQRSGVPTVFYLSDHWLVRGLGSDVWLRWWNDRSGPLLQRVLRRAWMLTGARRRWDACAPTNPIGQLNFQRIYFCSRALRDSTVAAGVDVSHGAVIYCPVHLRYFQAPFEQPRQQLRRLLYVGRLAEDKGVMTALRALALLPRNLQLSVYGRGEAGYVSGLRAFAQEQHLDVVFTAAEVEAMPQVYRSHDLLLFTSEWAEPFALTPIEAMACGLPVVATHTGGSAEIFRDGENALVYPSGNPKELAERIGRFAGDYPLRTRCALAGFSEARERFAAPVVVDQIEQYLTETLRTWRPVGLPLYSS